MIRMFSDDWTAPAEVRGKQIRRLGLGDLVVQRRSSEVRKEVGSEKVGLNKKKRTDRSIERLSTK